MLLDDGAKGTAARLRPSPGLPMGRPPGRRRPHARAELPRPALPPGSAGRALPLSRHAEGPPRRPIPTLRPPRARARVQLRRGLRARPLPSRSLLGASRPRSSGRRGRELARPRLRHEVDRRASSARREPGLSPPRPRARGPLPPPRPRLAQRPDGRPGPGTRCEAPHLAPLRRLAPPWPDRSHGDTRHRAGTEDGLTTHRGDEQNPAVDSRRTWPLATVRVGCCGLVLALMSSPPARAIDEECLDFEPAVVELTGLLVLSLEYGPPNWGADPDNDEKRQIPVLRLERPICVRGSGSGDPDDVNLDSLDDVREVGPIRPGTIAAPSW